MSIGSKIKLIRNKRHLTQKELSERAQINLRLLQKYEADDQRPKDATLKEIANALNVDLWALKDLDIDISNIESVINLLILLDEKGLFSIRNLSPTIHYVDHHPKCSISVPCSDKLLSLIVEWKYYSEVEPDNLDSWKANPGHIGGNYLAICDTYRNAVPTAILTSMDLLNYKQCIELLEKGSYTKTDFIRLLQTINNDISFQNDTTAYKHLCDILKSENIPKDFLFSAFEDISEFGIPEIEAGPVKQAYEASCK